MPSTRRCESRADVTNFDAHKLTTEPLLYGLTPVMLPRLPHRRLF